MEPLYGQSDSRNHEIDSPASNFFSSLAQKVGENMDIFAEIATSGVGRTPPQQTFSPKRDAWNSYAEKQKQRHAFLLEQMAPLRPEQHSLQLGDQSRDNAYIAGLVQAPNMQPGGYNGVGSFGERSRYSSPGLSNIDSEFTHNDCTQEYPNQIYSTGASLVASPGQMSSAAASPASFLYERYLPIEATGYIDRTPGYFGQYPSEQARHHIASVSQSPGLYPNQKTGSIASSPLTPATLKCHDGAQGTSASCSYRCPDCRVDFGRKTDLDRHKNTSRKHNKNPGGPKCPETGCGFITPFTRPDNFKAHFMNKHGRSSAEADMVIQGWKGSPRR